MTDAELDALDRLAAEKVMGWIWARGEFWIAPIDVKPYAEISIKEWQPTRNIAQAWECLEKADAFQLFRYAKRNEHQYEVHLWWDKNDSATDRIVNAETAPLAIVRACLKAKGVEL